LRCVAEAKRAGRVLAIVHRGIVELDRQAQTGRGEVAGARKDLVSGHERIAARRQKRSLRVDVITFVDQHLERRALADDRLRLCAFERDAGRLDLPLIDRNRDPLISQRVYADAQLLTHLALGVRRSVAGLSRLLLAFGLTALTLIAEAIGGWVSGSLALLADAGHMLTDVGALGLSLLTASIARRPADDRKTYGYLRWEILAALDNGAALIGIAAWVVVEAVHRLGEVRHVDAGLLLVVAAAGAVVNALALWLLHGGHTHSLNTRGAYLHIMGDLLGSVAALAAGLVIALTGWTPIDPILSVLMALLILAGAWRLVKESTDILLEAVPRSVSMAEVQQRMLAVEGVRAVHDLHVWTVTSGVIAMSGHAVVPTLASHPGVLDGIRRQMGTLGIGHVTIQLEVGDGCEPVTTAHDPHGAGGHGHVH